MPLRTGYVLPFVARIGSGRVFSAMRPVEVRCVPRGSPPASARAVAALRVFTDLAATGALAGAGIRPADSILVADPGRWTDAPPSASFTTALVDDAAAVVLANLLLGCADEYPLEELSMTNPGTEPTDVLRTDPDERSDYPARFAPLPFAIDDEEPSGNSFTVTAEFVATPGEATVESLRTELDRWFAAVLHGAYAVPPGPPSESNIEAGTDALAAYDSTVEWEFLKLSADTACLDGLVNLFAAFHHRVQPLTHLRIS